MQVINKITGEDVTIYAIALLEGVITQDEFEELSDLQHKINTITNGSVSYTHLRANET